MDSKLVIGVDVSKSNLDYLIIESDAKWNDIQQAEVFRICNDQKSITSLLSKHSPDQVYFVFEPTGTYSDKLLQLLVEAQYEFSLVTPRRAHSFSQTMGITTKDDQQAARLLAYMGARLELALYQAPTQEMMRRKQVLSALSGLMKQVQMVRNQLHSHQQYLHPQPAIEQMFQKRIESIEIDIATMEKELKGLDDQAFAACKKLAMSVVGVGKATANWLLIITQGLENFHTPGQLLKYCGLVGKSHKSGSSVNTKGGITKQACAKLRSVLYMAAQSAIRFNHACKDLYDRLRAKGKPFYKAIVAVMAKLVKQVFGVVKSEIPFDNEYYLKYQKN